MDSIKQSAASFYRPQLGANKAPENLSGGSPVKPAVENSTGRTSTPDPAKKAIGYPDGQAVAPTAGALTEDSKAAASTEIDDLQKKVHDLTQKLEKQEHGMTQLQSNHQHEVAGLKHQLNATKTENGELQKHSHHMEQRLNAGPHHGASSMGEQTKMSSAVSGAFKNISAKQVVAALGMIVGGAIGLSLGISAAEEMMDLAQHLFGDTGGDVAHMLLMGGLAYGAFQGVKLAANQFGKGNQVEQQEDNHHAGSHQQLNQADQGNTSGGQPLPHYPASSAFGSPPLGYPGQPGV